MNQKVTGSDKQGLEIGNKLKCAWKQQHFIDFFFPLYCYSTQWSWEKSRDEEYKGECPVGMET